MAAIEALHAAFPDHPLRLDPNAAWTPQTSVKVASGLAGILEYLEDPTPDIEGMAEVAQQAPMPLATNMCVVAFDQLAPAVAANAVKRGALRPSLLGRTAALPAAGRHLRHLRSGPVDALELASGHQPGGDGASRRARRRTSRYACDTHWPWKTEEVVKPGVLEIRDGAVAVPTAPRAGHRDRRRRAGRAARAVPAVWRPRPRRHRIHEERRSRLRGHQPALVATLMHHRRRTGAR